MSGYLLETKLHAPKPRPRVVQRARLGERLARGASSKVTLVSAPPGFGKSTLVAEWLGQQTAAVAWLSLDADDNDPARFWRYVAAALQTAHPELGLDAARALEPPEPQIDQAIHSVLNDLANLERDVVLVLDDFHMIDRRDIGDELAYVIDRLPAHAHLVMTTRADPTLPLARLRARGELVEIRAADLRFTEAEAWAYLNGTMGLDLGGADVGTLEALTEGWIAALQLAALSMQGRADPASFIASFAGDDRYVVDYLADEVLARQPPDVRRFLLQTSILDRLTASLCDAVTGGGGSRAMLERLDRGNLFLLPLDDQRRWYRYHNLFADVLRTHLLAEDPDSLPALHRRASDWFERDGDRSEAIRHALAGSDFIRAADLIEPAIADFGRTRDEVTLRRWLEALPDAVVRARPQLATALAGALMQTGMLAGVADLIATAEAALEGPAAATHAGPSESERVRLPGHLAMLRAGYSRITGDLPNTIAHAQRALSVAARDDHLSRGGAASLLGLARWETGDLDQAHRSFAAGMASLEAGGYRSDVVGGQVTLADIRIAQGRLGDAVDAYRRGLDLAVEGAGPPLRGAADMHVGMSGVLRERNDLVGAREHLAAGRALGEANGLPKNPYRSRLAEARLCQAEGDLRLAFDLLDDAERVFFADFSPMVEPIPAVRARLLIAHGRLAPAREWADRARVGATDDISYVRQFEHVTLARLLLAEGRVDEAVPLIDRLVAAAQDRGWVGAAIDALIVQALARQAGGDLTGAVGSMDAAFEFAAPEGYARVFLDEGPAMAQLLTLASKRGTLPSYAGELLRATGPRAARTPARRGLMESLSERELEVLRLLRSDLDGPAIANELVVSLNTLRTHTKNIYGKLGVSSRRAAVRRAEELDLL
ncbi:MAG: helix-turn-helix transcriptional regulator [Chloroflexota bacterium]|nr:MAG: helix-turn-helix transcriptional regulator [Chloroflexota bacterium]